MRHLFLAESDYAASGNMFSLALQSAGETTRCLIKRNHIYQYPQQGEVFGQDVARVQAAIESSDWVWIIQSDLPTSMGGTFSAHYSPARQEWMKLLEDKTVVLLHGGGHYRDHRDFYYHLWKDHADISICYEADLMGSFPNEHLVIPPVNPMTFEVRPRKPGRLRVGHFPSRPTDKGSEWIVPLLNEMDVEFYTSVFDPYHECGVHRVDFVSQMNRMSECDVIVDQVKPELHGKPFGEWVSIATEAAALGRVSIANSLSTEPYIRTYGREPGIHICNDREALISEIDRLNGLSEDDLVKEQKESREWIEEYHTLDKTGEILKTICQL